MNIFFFLKCVLKGLGMGCDASRGLPESHTGLLQIVCRLVELQGDLRASAAPEIFAGISRIQPEKLRMIIVHRLEHGLHLTHGHRSHRCKRGSQTHGICINLAVYLLHIRLQHSIIGIALGVKGQITACVPQGFSLGQIVCLGIVYLLCLLLHGLIAHAAAHGIRYLYGSALRLFIAALPLSQSELIPGWPVSDIPASGCLSPS